MDLIFILLLAAAPQNCDSAQTTMDLVECSDHEYRIADAKMTVEWKAAYARMKRQDAEVPRARSGYAAALLDSQRKWLAYRDAQCKVVGDRMRGGSGQGYSTMFCLTDLTRKRTTELHEVVVFGA